MHLNIDYPHLQLRRRLVLRLLYVVLAAIVGLSYVAQDTAAETPPTTLTEQDNSKTFSLAVGQVLAVQLPSNPTTGYQWIVLRGPEPLKLVKSEYATDPQAAGRAGAGGIQTLRFTAESPGKVELILAYKRPWELDTPMVKTFSVTIVVK